MKHRALLLFLLPLLALAQPSTQPDPWNRLRFFEGTWTGSGNGEPGVSTVEREYQFIMNGRYLQVKNRSTYAPQEKNPKGEFHEDWGIYSRDRMRKAFIFRQFNVEGFVNQYVLDTLRSTDSALVFVTEAIENIPAGWRGQETLRVVNADEFIEVFELAEPGKEFAVYSENRLRRVQQ